MVAVSSPTQSRPEARVFRVEELVSHARAGRIRVPRFQRGFKWERSDVQKLLDSIWRGYPIGTLLLSRRPVLGQYFEDLVATVTYIPEDKLALRLSREDRFERIRMQHFERLADYVGVPRDRVTDVVRETIARAVATWPVSPVDPARMAALQQHVQRLALVRDAA